MSENIKTKEEGNSNKKFSDEEFIDALEQLDGSASTSGIASIVGCTRRMADNRLRELDDSGRINKKKVGNSLLWESTTDEKLDKNICSYFADYMSKNISSKHNPSKGMVITIRKQHSQAILNGEKSIEFRRTRIESSDIPTIGFIYEPAPTKAIVSVFQIESIEQYPVDYLYEIGPANTPSTKESLKEYFSGKEMGTAIFIDDVQKIDPPIPLAEDEHGEWVFNPPQDFYYVEPVDFVQKIRDHYMKSESPGGSSHELGDFLNTS